MSKSRVFVLGADDPEMSAIAQLLALAGEKIEHAKGCDGIRVKPGTAYQAVSPAPAEGQVWVECANGWRTAADAPAGVTVIDHHRPGDPGFGAPPQKFWEASSVGQVFNLLANSRCGRDDVGRDINLPKTTLELAAAADHCLAAAYAGQCPGVNPDALLQWRLESRAAFQKKGPEELLDAVRAAIKTLHAAPASPLGESVADLRDRHTDELPEASCRSGRGYLAVIKDRDGRTKVVLGGCGEGTVPGPEPVQQFISEWGPSQGLVEIYGDPARGFAGGYLPR